MKQLYISLSLLLLALVGYAQPYGGKLTQSQTFEKADELYAQGDYYNALDWYSKILEKDDSNLEAISKVAETHFLLRDMKEAENWYAKLLDNDVANAYVDNALRYGRILKMNSKLDEAKSVLENFISESDNATFKQLAAVELEGIELARTMEEDMDVTVEDAGSNINSPYTDFSPTYGPNGEMYYSAMVSEQVVVLDGTRDDYFAKIYTANSSGDSWEKGQPLGDNINRSGVHTGNVALTKDGQTMYFTRTDLSSNMVVASTLYFSEKDGNDWGTAYPVEGLGDYVVKHPAVGEAYGKNVLFFVSDMDGGKGGDDIYYAEINDDGSLGNPTNLGSTINTAGNEQTPCYRDGMLYFSSNGHPSIGGKDVFYSEWSGSWGKPVNIGKGINSPYDDIYFSLDDTGYKGFVVSNRPSNRSLKSETCCDDIYDVNIKEVILDLETMVVDAKTGEPVKGATVQLVEMMDGTEGETETATEASTHKFGFPLDRETAYKVIAEMDGYESAMLEFNTVGLNETQTISKELKITPIPVEPVYEEVVVYDTIRKETPIILDRILYDFDRSDIRPEAEPDLQMVYDYMTNYPNMVIELSSHTDSKGNAAYNQRLSQRRAESAKEWLVEKGISADRIKTVGYGETMPIASNKFDDGTDNPDGRQLNRRTEFKIIDGPKYVVTSRVEKRVVKKEVEK